MTISTNMTFSGGVNTDNRLTLTVSDATVAGAYFESNDNADIAHNDGIVVTHPTISGLQRTGENHILTEGGITVVWTLSDSITQTQINNFLTWVATDKPEATVSHDSTAGTITLTYTVEHGQTSFRDLPIKYGPLRDSGRMTFTTGSKLACFLRTDGSPDDWTIDYRDIAASGSATIDKEGTHCYVFFSEPVTVGGTTLNAYEFYKITSASITAAASSATKVVRCYRD